MKRQLPPAEARESGAPGHGSSNKCLCSSQVNNACAQASSSQHNSSNVFSQTAAAKSEVLRSALALSMCPTDDCLLSSLVDVKRAVNQLEGLAELGVAEPYTVGPSGSQMGSLSNILSVLGESERRELGLDTEFRIGQSQLQGLIWDYFKTNEAKAVRMVEEFSNDTCTKPAALTEFKQTSVKVSTIRLAVFTGKRFLYSSCADTSGSDRTELCVPALLPDEAVDIPARAGELELFLKLVAGQPPKKVVLKDAISLFSVIEYSMASALHSIWIGGLVPLLKQLSAAQMAVMVSVVLGHSLCSCTEDHSSVMLLLSTLAESLGNKAEGASYSTTHNKASVTSCSEAAIFASKLLESAGSGSAAHLQALLQICSACGAPGWLQVGSIAATACCVKHTHTELPAECLSALRHVLRNANGVDVAAVLTDASVRASSQPQRQYVAALLLAMVQHETEENHKKTLWLTAQTVVDSPLLSRPATVAGNATLICLPLAKKDCFILVARMLYGGQTTVTKNWMLRGSCANLSQPPNAPHLPIYLHNMLDYPRKAQYVLGILPASSFEEVVSVLRKVWTICSSAGLSGLKQDVFRRPLACVNGVVASTFKPWCSVGRPWRNMGPALANKREQVAGGGRQDPQVNQTEVLAFCVVDETPS